VFTYLFCIVAFAAIAAGAYCLVAVGIRNGDRAGDALVTAQLRTGDQPQEARPVIVVTVRNPSGTAALAALRARRALLPGWLAGPHSVGVPRLTGGRRFRPGRYATVGVLPAGCTAELTLPVAVRARRYLLSVAIGQEGGRLRLHKLRLGPVCYTAAGQDDLIMVR
jgi:hypothetical protein